MESLHMFPLQEYQTVSSVSLQAIAKTYALYVKKKGIKGWKKYNTEFLKKKILREISIADILEISFCVFKKALKY